MRVHSFLMMVLLAVLAAGCAGERAEFSQRKDTDELIPEVQEHIQGVLDTHFGTPTQMIAWQRLPIQYGSAATATVAEGENALADGQAGALLTVTLSQENHPIAPGQRVEFLSGKYAGTQHVTVEAFEPEQGLLTLQEDGYDPPPSVGDQLVIGPGIGLQQGRMLYAEHCQHCHGVSGDGQGPTARYLHPPPRDYRLGKFKFTSTNTSDRAAREDLKTTIWEGIPGTYMPSFKLLTDAEMQSIVEYVLWLSLRGEIEYQEVRTFKNDYSNVALEEAIADGRDDGLSSGEARQQLLDELQEYLSGDWVEEFNGNTQFLAEQWVNAQAESARVIPQEAMPEYDYDSPEAQASRERGRALYLSAQAKCATCHGDQGLGDGSQTLAVQKNPITNEEYPLPGLYDDWGNPLKPRDLTQGIYRGGRRPVDLYRRVFAGIKGTPMPAFGNVLKPQDIWDIVNYVTSIPFESRQQKPGDGAGESRPEPVQVAAQSASSQTSKPATID